MAKTRTKRLSSTAIAIVAALAMSAAMQPAHAFGGAFMSSFWMDLMNMFRGFFFFVPIAAPPPVVVESFSAPPPNATIPLGSPPAALESGPDVIQLNETEEVTAEPVPFGFFGEGSMAEALDQAEETDNELTEILQPPVADVIDAALPDEIAEQEDLESPEVVAEATENVTQSFSASAPNATISLDASPAELDSGPDDIQLNETVTAEHVPVGIEEEFEPPEVVTETTDNVTDFIDDVLLGGEAGDLIETLPEVIEEAGSGLVSDIINAFESVAEESESELVSEIVGTFESVDDLAE